MAVGNSVPRRHGNVSTTERLVQRDWNAFKSIGESYRTRLAARSSSLGAAYGAVADFFTAADIAPAAAVRRRPGGVTARMVSAARWRRGIGVGVGGMVAMGLGGRLLDWATNRRRY